MSIRMVAVELYRVMKEIDGLEKELERLKAGSTGVEAIGEKLRKARAEKARLEKMIEGAKGD
jgi:predicted nuclease with TOPRIM domain